MIIMSNNEKFVTYVDNVLYAVKVLYEAMPLPENYTTSVKQYVFTQTNAFETERTCKSIYRLKCIYMHVCVCV